MKKKIIQAVMLFGLVVALFATSSMAQIIPVYLEIKTGTPSGAGGTGSKIKAIVTFINERGQEKVSEIWLGKADLANGATSRVHLVSSFFNESLPQVKKVRLENHGTDSVWTGDNWYCEYVCVQLNDRNICDNNFEFNRWVNGGRWVELEF